jgi:hypothetical protein
MAIIFEKDSNRRSRQRDHADVESHYDPEESTILLDRFKVSRATLARVTSELEAVLPLLQPQTEYSALDILGSKLWARLSHKRQREAVICLQHLAETPGTGLSNSMAWGCQKDVFEVVSN